MKGCNLFIPSSMSIITPRIDVSGVCMTTHLQKLHYDCIVIIRHVFYLLLTREWMALFNNKNVTQKVREFPFLSNNHTMINRNLLVNNQIPYSVDQTLTSLS